VNSSGGGALALAAVVLAGIAVRVIALDRLPGVNGDEAWFGVNVQEFIIGGAPFWSTPVGNPLNPFHSGPLFAVSLFMDPALILLRIPAALWGGLAVLLAYPLLRQPMGRSAAAYVTALIAVSATAVSQARLGWDPSGTPFFSLLAIAFALRARPVLAAAASAAALVVHPTNIFLLPIVAAAWMPSVGERYSRLAPNVRRRLAIGVAAAAALMAAAAVPMLREIAHRGRLPSVAIVLDRLFSPSAWMETARGVMDLFSGVTAATSIAAPINGRVSAVAAWVVALAFVMPCVIAWRVLVEDPRRRGPWLAGGLIASIGAFHVIAGPGMLTPGFERYAMFLVVPLAIVCAFLGDALRTRSPRAALALAAITCATLTVILVRGYFVPLVAYGGSSHVTYRTGADEPKAAAFEFIRRDSSDDELVTVFAENWWLYWPLRYLATGQAGRIRMELVNNEYQLPLYPAGVLPPRYTHAPDKLYVVAFDKPAIALPLGNQSRALFTAVDPAGQPIVHVFRITVAEARAITGHAPPWEHQDQTP
jgi:hypothetical protein